MYKGQMKNIIPEPDTLKPTVSELFQSSDVYTAVAQTINSAVMGLTLNFPMDEKVVLDMGHELNMGHCALIEIMNLTAHHFSDDRHRLRTRFSAMVDNWKCLSLRWLFNNGARKAIWVIYLGDSAKWFYP